jgi:hypothetical protein
MHIGSVPVAEVEAPMQDALPIGAAEFSVVVIYQDTGETKAGLYAFFNERWTLAIPYAEINDFIIAGGAIDVYLDLTTDTPAPSGATVYRNGVLSTATTITASSTIVWAAIKANATTGAAAGVDSFNGRQGTVTLTQADVSAVLPAATASTLGGVKQGTNITIAQDGTISANINASDIPKATQTTLGGVIVPAASGMTIDASGNIGLNLGTGLSVTANKLTPAVASVAGTAKQITATNTGGVVTLTTPQNIDATATPTFGGLTLTGPETITGALTQSGGNVSLASTGTTFVVGANTITSNSGSGSWAHTGNFTVQNGAVSSSAGAGVAGATNSGVNLNYGGTYGMVSLYDATRTAGNRSADFLFINGGVQLRFANDGYTAFATALNINGGQTSGITGITSSSGTGAWAHTGNFSVSGTTTLTGGTVGPTKLSQGYTVATLPAASTALKGARAFVTDANDGANMVWNNPVTTGGGANTVPVFCNGNSWVYG